MPSRTRRAGRILLAVVGGVLALVLGAWAIDSAVSSGQVLRHVELAGHQVGGLSEVDLRGVVNDVGTDLADTPVVLTTPTAALETTAGQLGVRIDTDATVTTATDAGRRGSVFLRPWRWIRSLVASQTVEPTYIVAAGQLTGAVSGLVSQNLTPATNPAIAVESGKATVVPGVSGTGIDTSDLGDRVTAAIAAGDSPVELTLDAGPIAPAFTDAQAQQVADRANTLATKSLRLVVAGKTTTVDPATLLSWMQAAPDATGTTLELRIDPARIAADLGKVVGTVGKPATDGTFNVGPAGVTFTEGVTGTGCCSPESSQKIIDALTSGAPMVELSLTTTAPAHDKAWADRMQIVEPIGSFTTNHAAGEARVQNIHRIADLIRGQVIEPGATFSVNDFVGKRTTDKGFVEAGVIYNGSFATDVGGGVSQFATTLFNAAFFAGLDFGEYQAHTIYISRYPYGREATLSYPHPDLQIRNTTPYGVLIWPTYTDSSITVTLYSTRWVSGEQTGQTQAPKGACTKVTTQRTRTWVSDGHTAVDTVSATYQPSEGVNC